MKAVAFLFLFLCVSQFSLGQQINGIVLDTKTKQPLESVSVYVDGTTIGVTTNKDGAFLIELDSKLTSQSILVISFIGYKSLQIKKSQLKDNVTYYLKEKEEFLDEVVLYDDWSRAKKLKIFKTQFLGFTSASAKCKILNENKLNLVYNKNEKKLYASSSEPLIIENKALGYLLKYDLVDFEVQYAKCLDCFAGVESVFYSGTTQFKELNSKVKNKYVRARKKAFHGSLLHFMRALSLNKLKEASFQLFVNMSKDKKKTLYANTTFNTVFAFEKDSLEGVKMFLKRKDKIVVRYNNFEQSALLIKDENRFFFINDFGIHSPVDKIIFGGRFGDSRISTLLPNNYYPK